MSDKTRQQPQGQQQQQRPKGAPAQLRSLRCETDALGAIQIGGAKTLAEARDMLHEEDFGLSEHGLLFRAMCQLVDAGDTDDALDDDLLVKRLERLGVATLAAIELVSPLALHAPAHAPLKIRGYCREILIQARRAAHNELAEVHANVWTRVQDEDARERAIESASAPIMARIADITRRLNGGKSDALGGGLISARDLMAKVFAPVVAVAPGLIVEGLTAFSGKPKMGKSWMLLALAIARAGGGDFLGGIPLECGPVLMLALEDTEESLQDRLRILLQGAPVPDDLTLATFASLAGWHMNNGGLDRMGRWLAEHPGATLIIDTLAKIQPVRRGNSNGYAEDYAIGARLKELADIHHAAVIVVTHNRKAAADDPLDEINATTGLMGAFDTGLVLRRTRGEADAVLHVTGRRIREAEMALHYDDTTCQWSLMGSAQEYAISKERRAIILAVQEIVKATGKPAARKDIAEQIGVKPSTVGYLLTQMVNARQIHTVSGGYLPISPNPPNDAFTPNPPNGANGWGSVRGPVSVPNGTPNGANKPASTEMMGVRAASGKGVSGVRAVYKIASASMPPCQYPAHESAWNPRRDGSLNCEVCHPSPSSVVKGA